MYDLQRVLNGARVLFTTSFRHLLSVTMHDSILSAIAHRRLRWAALLGLTVASTACLDVEDTSATNRYGSLTIRATAGSSGVLTARPTAAFFTGPQFALPDSRVIADRCQTELFAPEVINPGNLNAGESLELRVGGSVRQLSETILGSRLYVLSSPPTFEYSPGDSAQLTVQGAAGGFPGSQIAVRLAEPMRVNATTGPVAGETFTLRWQTNGDANSGVLVSLRYGTLNNEGAADRQVLCVVQDDGEFLIGPQLLSEYFASDESLREINVARWRTRTVDVDGRTRLFVVTSADTTLSSSN